MAPLLPRKELQAFIASCEFLISASRTDKMSKAECEIVAFYLSELQTVIKDT